MPDIIVVGAGLAGSEAAYYLAQKGHRVDLYDIKPNKFTKAHNSKGFAELVCSNSLKSNDLSNASGLLKEEMRILGSLIMEAADECEVLAGGALAVDREKFSDYITNMILNHKNINFISKEIKSFDISNDERRIIIATGPLTTDSLAASIKELTGSEYLYFFDAAAPIISADSIDYDKVFWAARYDKGSADYLNCPFDKTEYDSFYQALVSAKTVEQKDVDKEIFFESCMPIEVLAKRGHKTPLFGPMKPVGIIDHNDPDRKYHGIVQLRRENARCDMFNIVGFQTRLLFEEQKRVFRMIPGLGNAEFLRYGVMHRNTYIDSPRLLDDTNSLKTAPSIMFAGQITGVEGYIESAASGLYTAIQTHRMMMGIKPVEFSKKTCIGALQNYITDTSIKNFQPMNANFGIIEPLLNVKLSKIQKKIQRANIALDEVRKLQEVLLSDQE